MAPAKTTQNEKQIKAIISEEEHVREESFSALTHSAPFLVFFSRAKVHIISECHD